ncbi:hypothetical protein Tco_0875699 [Tanacetum coccineum]|uniref:Uncharacterized protein n=1 Tax=Tanacetum coccineum TaxID=301880 RepID=A0ABQ5BT71_9ASTR
MESQSETTQIVSALKLPVLKTREYDLWSMRMEQYLTFTDHDLWENYENFAASSQEGLDKTYDRFQKLISQLEIYGEVISQENANLKLLRSLPSAWNNIALIMKNKFDLDTLSMDDLYNNLKVYESEIKGKSSSSLNSQNVAFVSSHNSSSTNETVNTAQSVSATSSKDQDSTTSYIDADDLEEMDLKWQVTMLTMRVKRFIKKTKRKIDLNDKETVGFDRTKVVMINSFQAEECITNFALMAYTSQGISKWELESLEARIVVHENNEAVYDEDNWQFLKYDVQVKDISIKDLKNQLEEALKSNQMNKSEVVHSVFNSRESDVDDNIVNDRFKTGEGFHAVPPPYTRNYMPSRPDLSFAGSSGPLIEEWESDSDDDSLFRPKSDQTKPKFTKINFVKSGENMKSVNKENIHRQVEYPRKSQSPRDNRRN